MTESEAIKQIRNKACNDRCTEIHCDDSCMYGKDKCAFYMAIKSLEMQIPKKPIEKQGECYAVSNDGIKSYEIIQECPNCHSIALKYSYPCRCGQIIDWRVKNL